MYIVLRRQATDAIVVALAFYNYHLTTANASMLYIFDLIVDERERNRGLGTRLFQTLIQEGKRAGALSIVLQCDLTNTAAQRFFFRQGMMITSFGFSVDHLKPLPSSPDIQIIDITDLPKEENEDWLRRAQVVHRQFQPRLPTDPQKGCLHTFVDADKCIDDITDELITKRIFLIISNTFGANVIPVVHDFPWIQSIYIYCGNQKTAEEWTKPYSKVSGIFTKKPALLNKISHDVGLRDKGEDSPMSIFHLTEREHSLQKLTNESAAFMWYRLILIVLRLIAKYGNSKCEMIAECRAAYHDNESIKMKIDDFEKNYNKTEALSWYSKDSFAFRLLNKALRTQNTEVIFKFRFFIHDLHNQIEQLYYQHLNNQSSSMNHNFRVYRGQHLNMTEIDVLKRNINQLISMNSFLSTTSNEDLAKVFAGAVDQPGETSQLQPVLFRIDICNMSKEMTPFAILKYSPCCQNNAEDEVLFSIDAIFYIKSVEQQGNVWHVHLELSKEQNEASQALSRDMMHQIGSEPDPSLFGWFLFRMNKFDEAERYLHYMLEQLPSNDKGLGNVYNLLGLIYKTTHKLEESLEHYEKALTIYSSLNCHDDANVIAIHYNLALVCLELGYIREAEEQQEEAENKLLNSSQSHNPLLITQVNGLKAKIQAEYGDHTSALKNLEVVLKDKEKRLPPTHASIASTLTAIGSVHENMDNYVNALEYFKRALEVGKKGLPSDHKDLAQCHINIGHIYEKQKQI
ncbi:unnamed protein product, partial [Rotaria sp. Silwood1]